MPPHDHNERGRYGTQPVIDLINNQTSGDGKWCTPFAFRVLPALACSYSSTSSIVHGENSYSKSLGVDAKLEGSASYGLVSGSFSASVDYQTAKSGTQSSDKTYVATSATCGTYTVAAFTTLPLTNAFRVGVSRMSPSDQGGAAALVGTFGTHFTSAVVMGAKTTYTYEFTASSYSALTSSGLDVAVGASVSYLGAKLSASAHVSKHAADAKAFSKAESGITQSVVGVAAPPTTLNPDGTADISGWQKAVDKNPFPIQHSLQTIAQFLTKECFPQDPDIVAKQGQLGAYLRTYCAQVKNCAAVTGEGYWELLPPSPDPKVCAASVVVGGKLWAFGGTPASTYAGYFDMNGDPKAWVEVAPMPTARRCATATGNAGISILVFGGTGADGAALAQVGKYSIAQDSWATGSPAKDAPVARSEAAAVSLAAVQPVPSRLRGLAVVAGGQLDVHDTSLKPCAGPTAAVEVFDANANVWSQLADMSAPRQGLGLAAQLSALYAVGGHDGTDYVATLEVLDVAAAAGAAWRTLAPMQYPRAGAAVGIVDGHLVVAGGVGPNGPMHVVEYYDLANASLGWSHGEPMRQAVAQAAAGVVVDPGDSAAKLVVAGGRGDAPAAVPRGGGAAAWAAGLPAMPTARSGLAVGVAGNTLYAVGGYHGNDAVSTVEAFDTALQKWSTLPSMPTARGFLAVGVAGNTLYAVGGVEVDNDVSTVEAFDTASQKWSTLPSMPTARNALAVDVVGNTLYAVGGNDGNDDAVSTVEAFDTASQKWSTLPSMLAARGSHAVGVVGTTLYAVGGYNGNNAVSTVEALDTASQKWSTLPSMPAARHYLAVGVAGTTLDAVGGYDGNDVVSTVEAFDTASQKWSTMPSMPAARGGLAVGVAGNTLYAVGGYNGNNAVSTVDSRRTFTVPELCNRTILDPLAPVGAAVMSTTALTPEFPDDAASRADLPL